MPPEIKDRAQHYTTHRSEFVLLYLKTEQFCKSTRKQLQKSCDDFSVARSTVQGQQCGGNSLCAKTSCDAI